jgi:uncharacterized protein (TIGR03086 family)
MPTAAEATISVVEGIRPDQLSGPTPCTEFDVRALRDHLAEWTGERAVRAARKLAEQTSGRGRGISPGLTEAPPPSGYADHARLAGEAWSQPAAWTGETSLTGEQKMPAQFVGGLVFAEFVLHGWDLAVATGQRLDVGDDIAETLYGQLAGMAEMARQYKVFGPEVPVPDSAPALDRALGLAGRDPHWSP